VTEARLSSVAGRVARPLDLVDRPRGGDNPRALFIESEVHAFISRRS
jgi:hypothetical protein